MSQCQQGALFVVPHNRNSSSRHSQPRHSQPSTLKHSIILNASHAVYITTNGILAHQKVQEINECIVTWITLLSPCFKVGNTYPHHTEYNKMNAKRTETQDILAQQKIRENSKTPPIDIVHEQQKELNGKYQESNCTVDMNKTHKLKLFKTIQRTKVSKYWRSK
eukprot:158525_1